MSLTKGGRNLLILGAGSTIFALIATGIALAIYHHSGDIYLDRSRPGFLPDETEADDTSDNEGLYTFSQNGAINIEALDEYLENLKIETDMIDKYIDPFGADALSDEKLGI